jgi:hypothetical protein
MRGWNFASSFGHTLVEKSMATRYKGDVLEVLHHLEFVEHPGREKRREFADHPIGGIHE